MIKVYSLNNDENAIKKIIIAGDPNVGKTTILKTYLEDKGIIKPTVGVNIYPKRIKLEDHTYFDVQFWDLSGQPAFSQVRNSFYKDTNLAIIVYDVTSIPSLRNIGNWVNEIKKINPNKNMKWGIIGNKIDLKDQIKVNNLEAQGFVKKFSIKFGHPIYFAECSGKENINIKETIAALVKILIEKNNTDENT